MTLSKRLQMLANMVTPGNVLADVGCDHGFLSVYLVEAGVCPRALAMDVRSGPLAGAERHVRECGLGDYIEVRLSDGLREYEAGEADALVCAGMGGRLMERILREGAGKAERMRELILQPQSELPRFRAFLRNMGYAVIQEDAVYEEGKYYFAMKAVPGYMAPGQADGEADGHVAPRAGCGAGGGDVPEREVQDMFGRLLLANGHPVLYRYLRQRESHMRRMEATLAAAGSEKALRRLGEIQGELKMIESALLYF